MAPVRGFNYLRGGSETPRASAGARQPRGSFVPRRQRGPSLDDPVPRPQPQARPGTKDTQPGISVFDKAAKKAKAVSNLNRPARSAGRSTGRSTSSSSSRPAGGPIEARYPKIQNPADTIRQFYPEYESSERERQARLSRSLEGMRAARQQTNDLYRTAAARAGIDASSGVAQNVLGGLLSQGQTDIARAYESDFLQQEDMRRQREDAIANLTGQLESSRIGGYSSVESSRMAALASLKAAQAQAAATRDAARIGIGPAMGHLKLAQQSQPLDQLKMLMDILNPYGIQWPRDSSQTSTTTGQGHDNRFADVLANASVGIKSMLDKNIF